MFSRVFGRKPDINREFIAAVQNSDIQPLEEFLRKHDQGSLKNLSIESLKTAQKIAEKDPVKSYYINGLISQRDDFPKAPPQNVRKASLSSPLAAAFQPLSDIIANARQAPQNVQDFLRGLHIDERSDEELLQGMNAAYQRETPDFQLVAEAIGQILHMREASTKSSERSSPGSLFSPSSVSGGLTYKMQNLENEPKDIGEIADFLEDIDFDTMSEEDFIQGIQTSYEKGFENLGQVLLQRNHIELQRRQATSQDDAFLQKITSLPMSSKEDPRFLNEFDPFSITDQTKAQAIQIAVDRNNSWVVELLDKFSEREVANVRQRQSVDAIKDPHNPALNQKIERIKQGTIGAASSFSRPCPYMRPIRGDGDCYYRSVMFGLVEGLIAHTDPQEKIRMCTELKSKIASCPNILGVRQGEGPQKAVFLVLLGKIERGELSIQGLEALVNDPDTGIDAALIYCARGMLVAKMKEYENQIFTQGGRGVQNYTLSQLIAIQYDGMTIDQFCEKYIIPREVWAEGPQIDAGLLFEALGVSGNIILLDRSERPDSLISLQGRRVQGPLSQLSVTVLLRPGHYDLLYPQEPTYLQTVRRAAGL